MLHGYKQDDCASESIFKILLPFIFSFSFTSSSSPHISPLIDFDTSRVEFSSRDISTYYFLRAKWNLSKAIK